MSSSPAGGRFRPDIQGLRAVAVLAVVLYHAGIPGLGGGYTGVDVFFVISGFLVTGHLRRSLLATGRIGLADFYARRARRILPASFVVLGLTAAAAFFVVSPLRLVEVLRDAVATALYVPNISFAIQRTDYLADAAPSPFQHYWSLGVEEQFYLLWPLLMLGLFLLARRLLALHAARGLAIGVAALAVASFTACLVVATQSQPAAFFLLPTRAWELAIGGLVACASPLLARMRRGLAGVTGWAGLAAVVASATLFTPATPYPGPLTVLPVLGAAAIIAGGLGEAGRGPTRLLATRPLQFLGLISYSLYLVHWPLLVLFTESAMKGAALPPLIGAMLAAASVPLAWLLFRFVETPLRVPGAVRRARRTLTVAGAASLALALVFVGGQSATALMPLDAGHPAAGVLTRFPAGTPFVPDNLRPALAAATEDTGELYTDGCQQSLGGSAPISCAFGDLDSPTTVVLFGDSHAGRWFPAMKDVAEMDHVRLQTYAKSGCRSEETTAHWAATDNPSCARWRAAVLARLAAHPPAVIVLASHLGPTPGADPAATERDWTDGLTTTVGRLPASSRVVLLADTPEFPYSAPMCLSSHVADAAACAAPRADALNPAIVHAEHTVHDRLGVGLVDLTDYLCNRSTCPAVIGSTLVYSDEHHVTASFSARLNKPLRAALGPYLRASATQPRPGGRNRS